MAESVPSSDQRRNTQAPHGTPEPMTLDRLGRGLARALDLLDEAVRGVQQIAAEVDKINGRVDRMAGEFAGLSEQIADLRVAMPEPARWCPEFVDDEGTVVCPGGVRLLRSMKAREDAKRREWYHPLPEGVTARVRNPATGEPMTVRHHNVFESRALREPPAGGERPAPEHWSAAAEPDEEVLDDDLPF